MRLAAGKGNLRPAPPDASFARRVAAWAKAAHVDVEGTWPEGDLSEGMALLAAAMRAGNPATPGSATVAAGSSLVMVVATRAPRGALHTDLAAGHTHLLAAFARGAQLQLHVHALLPGRGGDAELAALAALGQAWQMPASVATDPASAIGRDRLLAEGRSVAASGIERRDLPEVAGARRRSAEVRKPARKKAS